jgi:hypothetical protein
VATYRQSLLDHWYTTEVGALRILFSRDRDFRVPTEKQLKALNALVGDGFRKKTKKQRIAS